MYKKGHQASCSKKRKSWRGSPKGSDSDGLLVGVFKLVLFPLYIVYWLLFRSKPLRSNWLPILIVVVLAVSFTKYWWIWIPVAFTIGIILIIQQKSPISLRKTMAEIDAMDGTEFEKYLVEFFQARGYKAEHTGRSGDFGADLIIEGKEGRIAVQAKNYDSSKVGNAAVQQAVASASYYNCDRAMVVTNNYFTQAAWKQAKGSSPPAILVDRDGFEHLLRTMV